MEDLEAMRERLGVKRDELITKAAEYGHQAYTEQHGGDSKEASEEDIASAKIAVNMLIEALVMYEDINSDEFLEKASSEVHKAWVERNWLTNGKLNEVARIHEENKKVAREGQDTSEMARYKRTIKVYEELSNEEKGKDRIFVRAAIEAYKDSK